jgi:hypothetical protein
MDITEMVRVRIRMSGGKDDKPDILGFCIEKALQEASDFCNISGHEYFPKDAKMHLVEWAAAEYLTETDGYSKQWEKMRENAERGLIRFRRMRW